MKHKCEIRTIICSGSLMQRMTGTRKDDPKVWVCGACLVYLKKGGVRLVPVKEKASSGT